MSTVGRGGSGGLYGGGRRCSLTRGFRRAGHRQVLAVSFDHRFRERGQFGFEDAGKSGFDECVEFIDGLGGWRVDRPLVLFFVATRNTVSSLSTRKRKKMTEFKTLAT